MGRRIPGKKHRGIKDPLKQQVQKQQKVKNVVNRKPKDIDSQEIPRRVQNIMQFKEQGQTKLIQTKKRKKNNLIDSSKFVRIHEHQPGMTRPLKMLPHVQQRPGEKDYKFKNRVHSAVQMVLKESSFEDKFQVDVQRDMQGNVIAMQCREKNDPLMDDKDKEKQQERLQKKREKRREREKKRKGKHKKDEEEFEPVKDEIMFGEVVLEPPKLETEKLTRKLKPNGKARTDSLLFTKMLAGNKMQPDSSSKAPTPSMAKKKILEEERLKAVAAYRQIKAQQLKKNPIFGKG
ncbi:coiled-coil domain-containing protein 137 [Oratosquilla oratoria]|uniref:coiled-coil domain-containing protein 137 n=1 Tax=Oratosquilla oratoria TaxID=337810 RepID=UPI003F757F7C